MLTHLHVENFTLVDQLALDLRAGMTVITGETGAGKSILLGALGLAVGDRADADKVRMGANKADVTATFDVSRLPEVAKWLKEHDLEQSDAPHECLLRRTLSADGKSKAFINGRPATLSQLRALGDRLIDIHSQHEHQSLLNPDTHLRLVDEFANQQALAADVRLAYREWQSRTRLWKERLDNQEETSARYQLLAYQVGELDQLGLEAGELDALETEQRQLTNIDTTLRSVQQAYAFCSDDEQGLRTQVNRALQLLRQVADKPKALCNAEEMLESAAISIDEASHELDYFLDSHTPDPERLHQVEERLGAIYEIARKHRVRPEALLDLYKKLTDELETLNGSGSSVEQLEEAASRAQQHFFELGQKLSTARTKAAQKLEKSVNKELSRLAMENARLSINLISTGETGAVTGLESIEFLVSTNLGQLPRPLAKVASGGELSRISLAIQVVTAQTSTIPTLVFDEVDVGIGGATGEIVGQLLRELGERGQVFCVTHLAQVASLGHHHLRVAKASQGKTTASDLRVLSADERVDEIARMMGGVKLTEQTRAHAREMLEAVLP